jgi:hypothetical protein
MKKFFKFCFALFLGAISLLIIMIVIGANVEVDDPIPPSYDYYLSGCNENMELMVPTINIWSKPGGIVSGARLVGKVSATKYGKCRGEKFAAIAHDGQFFKIKTESGLTGWVTISLIGDKIQ